MDDKSIETALRICQAANEVIDVNHNADTVLRALLLLLLTDLSAMLPPEVTCDYGARVQKFLCDHQPDASTEEVNAANSRIGELATALNAKFSTLGLTRSAVGAGTYLVVRSTITCLFGEAAGQAWQSLNESFGRQWHLMPDQSAASAN